MGQLQHTPSGLSAMISAPIYPSDERADGRDPAPSSGTPRHPPGPITVLLVDDDEDCRLLVRDAISECDVPNKVVEVSDGHQAIEYLRRSLMDGSRPGLIFLDVEMPRLNGLDCLRKIKADPHLRDIPVVMLTGLADEESIKRAADYGANSYTVKPGDAEQFLKTVLASATYWLRVHQYPNRQWPPEASPR